jgi:hypothetical protein
LKQQWRDLFETEPPRFLEHRLTYRIQELGSAGLKPETLKPLAIHAGAFCNIFAATAIKSDAFDPERSTGAPKRMRCEDSLHSMPSSAANKSPSGTSIPSALAVLRIDGKIELGWHLHRQVSGLGVAENPIDVVLHLDLHDRIDVQECRTVRRDDEPTIRCLRPSPGAGHADHKTKFERVLTATEDDRNDRGCGLPQARQPC